MKLLPYCRHFQITSVVANTILHLSFISIKVQIDHQILINLRVHGNKTDEENGLLETVDLL